jgi:hypothetical protein
MKLLSGLLLFVLSWTVFVPCGLFHFCPPSSVVAAVTDLRQHFTIRDESGGFVTHKLLLGTHTSDEEQNYLKVAKVRLPTESTPADQRQYNDEDGGMSGAANYDGFTECTTACPLQLLSFPLLRGEGESDA